MPRVLLNPLSWRTTADALMFAWRSQMEIYNLTGCHVYLLNQKNELVMSCSMVQPFKGNLENHGKMKRLKAFLATLPAYTRVIIAQEHMEQLSEVTIFSKIIYHV